MISGQESHPLIKHLTLVVMHPSAVQGKTPGENVAMKRMLSAFTTRQQRQCHFKWTVSDANNFLNNISAHFLYEQFLVKGFSGLFQ